MGHKVVAIVPPPHYERDLGIHEWWHTFVTSRSQNETERGLSGELIHRTPFLPAGRSLSQRILNQATVALGALWEIIRQPKWLRKFNPDLVIGTVPALPTALVALIASWVLRVPFVIDLRDAWPDLLTESEDWNRATGKKSVRERLLTKGPFQVLRYLTRVGVNLSLRKADAILVTSSFLADDLRQRPELESRGVPPQVVVVRNLFPSLSPLPKRRNHSEYRKQGQLNVLYAGTLGRAQNLQNVLEAFELARNMGVDINLRMVGAGVSREALTQYIHEHNLEIVIESRKQASELQEAYEWADTALVHLTDWEPLKRAVPSKTYELMSSGIHICGVIAGETAELIQELQAGHVVPPESPLELASLWARLANSRELLRVSDQGAAWVESQRVDEVPVQIKNLVERLGGKNA